MEAFRRQEASLESSEGFYGAADRDISVVPRFKDQYADPSKKRESMKIDDNPRKSSKIFEMRRKSSESKKPAWNRATVSIRATGLTFKYLSLQACEV